MASETSWRVGKSARDWINLICGVLLFISPWALAFSGNMTAAITAWVGGVVIAIMGLAALIQFAEWEDWVALVAGLLMIIAPGDGLRRCRLCGLGVCRARCDRGGRLSLGIWMIRHPAARAG